MLRILFLVIIILSFASCERIALILTPAKKLKASNTELAKTAENQFWTTLHSGNYSKIEEIEKLLMAAYLENPNDALLAAHLGFLHIWKITERQRLKNIPAEIVNETILAKKYFSDAVELTPKDARYLGFLGDSQLFEGNIFEDKREQVIAYFTLKKAIHEWPEFNYFTAGFAMSNLSAADKSFQEGLEWQWKTLDLCAGEKISRDNPDYSKYMRLEIKTGPKRVCWNSWIAPYNFEGFFMNMGDMLVKSGNPAVAIKIYQNAKLDKNYAYWPYKKILESKITNAKENVKNFQEKYLGPEKTIMLNSGYGCMACHENKGTRL